MIRALYRYRFVIIFLSIIILALLIIIIFQQNTDKIPTKGVFV
jgi:hypothetical protein